MLKTDEPGAPAPTQQDEIEAVQRLLAEGRAAEAEPRLRVLAAANPDQLWFWVSLAHCYEAMGDTAAELDACEKALALDPSRGRLRMRAAAALAERGDLAAAEAHYRMLSDAHPQSAKLALRLARVRGMLGDKPGEAAAWARLLAVEPGHPEANLRLADMHERAGRLAEAAAHLKQVAQSMPDKLRIWTRLAHAAEAAGDAAEAQAAWRRIVELNPADVDAPERLALLRFSESPSGRATASGLRMVVLGNCQAYAMARCLRALNPSADIAAVSWADLRSPAHVERLKATLAEVDAVVTQPANHLREFSPKTLIRGSTRAAFFPGLHFTGFQPDAVRVMAKGLKSLIGEWHSALIIAAYRMGLPKARAEELFNAYVYGALGYFDEYAKAATFLRQSAEQIEWELAAELETWPRPFVHTPNHPRIEVMMDIARGVCGRLGLDAAPDPVMPPDPFVAFGAWPIYLEIGKRLGLAGEMIFVSPLEQGRALDLREALAWFYAAYAKVPADVLALRRVDEVIERLKAEGI